MLGVHGCGMCMHGAGAGDGTTRREQRKKERVEYCEKMLVQREQIQAALSTQLERAMEAVKTARADLISAVERMGSA